MPSPIKESAIKQGDKLYTGKRHGGIIIQMAKEGCSRVFSKDQGFVTLDGEFLNRKQAYKRAMECGQINDNGKGDDQALLSEDLY